MSDPEAVIHQTVVGNNNIFSGSGDVFVIHHPLPPAEAQTRAGLLNLIKKVKTFWIEGILEKSIHRAVLIDLGKELETETVDHPWKSILELPGMANGTPLTRKKPIDIFDSTGRALLILGEPGSGKSTTLLELAHDLLGRAENDQEFTQPIPVIFYLSTWTDSQQPLFDWLLEELAIRYQIPKRIGRSWLENNRLLPLLDGLDEVKAEKRSDCVKAINAFGREFGLPGLAVCSRIQEYLILPDRLELSAALRLQPLTSEQIDRYLAACSAKLGGLQDTLHQDRALQTLAQSPLMLNIMALAYQDIPANILIQQEPADLENHRRHMFDTYIKHMFKRRLAGQLYSLERTVYWLSWLAKQMLENSQTIISVDEVRPTWLTPVQERWRKLFVQMFYCLIGGMAGGLIGGLAFLSLIWMGNAQTAQSFILSKNFLVLAGGGAGVLLGWIASNPGHYWSDDEEDILKPGDPVKAYLNSLVTAGLIYALGFGVISGVFMALFALVVPLLPGPGNNSMPGPFWKLGGICGLDMGIFMSTVFIIIFSAKMVHYYSTRIALWLCGYTPWDYGRFLDYAADRIFLRKVGRGYIFIHRLLMEHFAWFETVSHQKANLKN